MPNIFTVSGYRVYFWANENNEPIHVHISKGSPVPNSTKVWLTRAGGCIVANNKSNIPEHELKVQTAYGILKETIRRGGYNRAGYHKY